MYIFSRQQVIPTVSLCNTLLTELLFCFDNIHILKLKLKMNFFEYSSLAAFGMNEFKKNKLKK